MGVAGPPASLIEQAMSAQERNAIIPRAVLRALGAEAVVCEHEPKEGSSQPTLNRSKARDIKVSAEVDHAGICYDNPRLITPRGRAHDDSKGAADRL